MMPDDDGRGTAPRGQTELDPQHRVLLADIRVQRSGPADPVDTRDWLRRETHSDSEARLGPCPVGGLWLIDVLERAGLSGRGGGYFPAAKKWIAALAAGRTETVVANASESEPLSAKDATLLRQRPHLVLDGLALAAETLGGARTVVWLHSGDLVTRVVVEDAIAERVHSGLRGCPPDVVVTPDSYTAGESSAIEQALAGGPAVPTFRGFGPHGRGRADRPATVVHNVETLARTALVARAAAPDGLATPAEHLQAVGQSVLVTVLTPVDRVVLEAPPTATVADVISAAGWTAAAGAVLLGGFAGTWARPGAVGAVSVTDSALRAVGLGLGAGVISPLPPRFCGVAETAAIVGYLADSSARQCGPCLFGLASVASQLDKLRRGRARRGLLRRIAADLAAVSGRGACHHPDGAVRLVASALDVFAADFAAHADGRPCVSAEAAFIPVPEAG